eukprot:CAMPEP_0116876892 /NCGR_PEP_ID=MMETSP0463-20121206/8750_1 /TAXON_ID=181622 /ORGANISM="Strombidinopsis sp, Strain SopsisLIS2011" /LENGTH=202 /DNA_ID=CAMNT_0004523783 /DNA_START=28 /DNA_END=636 /DNA_ORIENTATION=-
MPAKLYYFDLYGRAEAIRMILTHAKVEFEDVRLNKEQFGEMVASGKLEFNQVPAFEMEDGKVLTQGVSILRYLGAKHGYYPTDALKAWEADSMIDAMSDFNNTMRKIMFAPNEEAKAAAQKEFAEVHAPTFFTRAEKRLAGQKYFGGDSPNVFDFFFGSFMTSPLAANFQSEIDKHSGIKASVENWNVVFADYLANRPKCSF